MTERSEANDTTPPRNGQQPDWISRSVAHIKAYFKKRRAEKSKEAPADRAGRQTATATWVIALSTVATLGVGISQYLVFSNQLTVMQGQLDEMKSSSVQTNKLVQAAADQARALIDTARISEAALEQAAKEFEVTARPVVNIVSPLEVPHFDDRDPERTYAAWTLHFLNSGRSPALRMAGEFKLTFPDPRFSRESLGTFEVVPTAGAPIYTTIFSKPMSRESYDNFLKSDGGVVISGSLTYFDVYGNVYETAFCTARDANGSMRLCGGNYMK